MKQHIQIKDSYKIWKPFKMECLIFCKLYHIVANINFTITNYNSLFVEWWIHNIGYYLTKPFTFIPWVKALNLRFKDVDLMVDYEVTK